jgi:hypothetical protein
VARVHTPLAGTEDVNVVVMVEVVEVKGDGEGHEARQHIDRSQGSSVLNTCNTWARIHISHNENWVQKSALPELL